MKKIILALIVPVLVLGVMAIAVRDEQDDAALDAARTVAGDPIAQLDLGRTRYRIAAPGDGPMVVLIHSFNGYLESWDPNVDALADAGYRVLRYDLWGRGLSARPDVDLSLDVFRKQLHDLLDEVGHKDSVALVGASFGCVIAADYAEHYPDEVSRLALIGPAGWPAKRFDPTAVLSVPIVGEVIFGFFAQELTRATVLEYFLDPDAHAWAIDTWGRYAAQPGSSAAALSTLRHSPVRDFSDGWKALGELGKPTLFVWGKQDVSFPYSNASKAAVLVPQAEIVGIDGAAHWVNIEQADKTNAAVLAFLAE